MSENFEKVKGRRREIFFNNILGGLAWGIGATLGLAILFTILGFVAQHINLVPIVGNFVSEVIDFVIAKNPHL